MNFWSLQMPTDVSRPLTYSPLHTSKHIFFLSMNYGYKSLRRLATFHPATCRFLYYS